jgi:hypothetical protein
MSQAETCRNLKTATSENIRKPHTKASRPLQSVATDQTFVLNAWQSTLSRKCRAQLVIGLPGGCHERFSAMEPQPLPPGLDGARCRAADTRGVRTSVLGEGNGC